MEFRSLALSMSESDHAGAPISISVGLDCNERSGAIVMDSLRGYKDVTYLLVCSYFSGLRFRFGMYSFVMLS